MIDTNDTYVKVNKAKADMYAAITDAIGRMTQVVEKMVDKEVKDD